MSAGTATELRAALRERVEANKRIQSSFKVGKEATGLEHGVVVDAEAARDFRKNLDEAREIKSLLDGVEDVKSMESWLSEPESAGTGSAAMRAAAAAAGGIALPGPLEGKSLGQAFTDSDEFKDLKTGSGAFLWFGLLGCVISVPLWAFHVVEEWGMIGITLVLSFAALWYAAFITKQEIQHGEEIKDRLDRIEGRVEVLIDVVMTK